MRSALLIWLSLLYLTFSRMQKPSLVPRASFIISLYLCLSFSFSVYLVAGQNGPYSHHGHLFNPAPLCLTIRRHIIWQIFDGITGLSMIIMSQTHIILENVIIIYLDTHAYIVIVVLIVSTVNDVCTTYIQFNVIRNWLKKRKK